ncbi:Mitogen-activated protein kinase kinase kinase 4 [Linum perenne]
MDVWALGCTVLEMVINDQVWKGWRSKEDGLKIMIGMGNHPAIPEWLCEEGKDFLKMCFEKCSSWRASYRELLRHPFVGGGSGGEVEVRPTTATEEKRISPCFYLPHLMCCKKLNEDVISD